jgi:hypothetical protein
MNEEVNSDSTNESNFLAKTQRRKEKKSYIKTLCRKEKQNIKNLI